MALKEAETRPLKLEVLREMSVADLEHELLQLQEAQFRLKFRSATEAVAEDNPLQFRTIRRNIARLKTVLREMSHE